MRALELERHDLLWPQINGMGEGIEASFEQFEAQRRVRRVIP